MSKNNLRTAEKFRVRTKRLGWGAFSLEGELLAHHPSEEVMREFARGKSDVRVEQLKKEPQKEEPGK